MYGVDGVIGFTYDGVGNFFYIKNIFGDIIGIFVKNGQEIAKYTYDAWGKHKTYVLNDSQYVDISTQTSYTQDGLNNKLIAEINPVRYRGYYFDSETNIYYLNFRYYDPETGRFLNADNIIVLLNTLDKFNGLNLYSYCFNNLGNSLLNGFSDEFLSGSIFAGASMLGSSIGFRISGAVNNGFG